MIIPIHYPLKNITVTDIDAVLPQTQCTKCGFQGCLPYAEAIVTGDANINQCPPGGDEGIHALAALTGLPYRPLDTTHGEHYPRLLAVIDEDRCIGCTLCIQACPVDAILGAAKKMHTVIARECTGCDLCLVPCPVDCIDMIPAPPRTAPEENHAREWARQRHHTRNTRLARLAAEKASKRAKQIAARQESIPEASNTPNPTQKMDKMAIIQAAMQRAAAQRATTEQPMATNNTPLTP